MLIVFLGPPGSGKGTQSKRLANYLNIPQLSTGEMLRAAKAEDSSLGRLAAHYMDAGRLVPDPIVMNIVGHRLERCDCANGCLFDGFPRTVGQATSLDLSLQQRGTPLNAVLELQADEAELVRRMLKRAAEERRADDNPKTIEQRMEVYRRQTSPLSEYYRDTGRLHLINAMQPPDAVFADIKACIDRLR